MKKLRLLTTEIKMSNQDFMKKNKNPIFVNFVQKHLKTRSTLVFTLISFIMRKNRTTSPRTFNVVLVTKVLLIHST